MDKAQALLPIPAPYSRASQASGPPPAATARRKSFIASQLRRNPRLARLRSTQAGVTLMTGPSAGRPQQLLRSFGRHCTAKRSLSLP